MPGTLLPNEWTTCQRPDDPTDQDCAVLPDDLTIPITERERAYYEANTDSEETRGEQASRMLNLLSVAVGTAVRDGDRDGALRLANMAGLDTKAIQNEFDRMDAKGVKAGGAGSPNDRSSNQKRRRKSSAEA